MVDHVVHFQVRETQRRVIVVQLQRGNARGVRAEAEHEDIAHQPHVLIDVLWNSVHRPRHVGLLKRGPKALDFAGLASAIDPLLHQAVEGGGRGPAHLAGEGGVGQRIGRHATGIASRARIAHLRIRLAAGRWRHIEQTYEKLLESDLGLL